MMNLTRDSAGSDYQKWYQEKNPSHPLADAIAFAIFQCEMAIRLRHTRRAMAREARDRSYSAHRAYNDAIFVSVCEDTIRLDDRDYAFLRIHRRQMEASYPATEIEAKWAARYV